YSGQWLRSGYLGASRGRGLYLRGGNGVNRIARRETRLSPDQAAVFSGGARALYVPDNRQQRGDVVQREAHRADGRDGVREAGHAQQYRDANRVRERPRAKAGVL